MVCALYHFVSILDCSDLQRNIKNALRRLNIKGTILIAPEGINGTIAGHRPQVTEFVEWLHADERFKPCRVKVSAADRMPFHRTRVKLKQEIVTMGVPDIDPRMLTGTYIKPAEWNKLIADPEVTLIDTRNDYEISIGTFAGAINPQLGSFREFPDYARNHLDPGQHKKIAMFCTGGIRCEKSTAYLKSKGFAEVYHLEGGILNYLEQVPGAESQWQGECFVFDDRVAVDHRLQPGSYEQCHACRMPVNETDKQHPDYVHGVSCAHCINHKSDTARERFRERERQVQLAEARGEVHIGVTMNSSE